MLDTVLPKNMQTAFCFSWREAAIGRAMPAAADHGRAGLTKGFPRRCRIGTIKAAKEGGQASCLAPLPQAGQGERS